VHPGAVGGDEQEHGIHVRRDLAEAVLAFAQRRQRGVVPRYFRLERLGVATGILEAHQVAVCDGELGRDRDQEALVLGIERRTVKRPAADDPADGAGRCAHRDRCEQEDVAAERRLRQADLPCGFRVRHAQRLPRLEHGTERAGSQGCRRDLRGRALVESAHFQMAQPVSGFIEHGQRYPTAAQQSPRAAAEQRDHRAGLVLVGQRNVEFEHARQALGDRQDGVDADVGRRRVGRLPGDGCDCVAQLLTHAALQAGDALHIVRQTGAGRLRHRLLRR
jgi:hypothetical protein